MELIAKPLSVIREGKLTENTFVCLINPLKTKRFCFI